MVLELKVSLSKSNFGIGPKSVKAPSKYSDNYTVNSRANILKYIDNIAEK